MQQVSKSKKVKLLFGQYEEIPIDWEIKSFDELFEFVRTGTNSRDDLKERGDIQYIHYGDIHTKWHIILDCNSEQIPWIDKAKVLKLPFLMEGDLIIADASEDYEGSGVSILLKNVKNRKIVSGLHTIALRNTDKNIYSDFKAYLTSMRFVKRQIIAYVTGISVFGLSKNNLRKIKIPFPPYQEQQKITSILSNVDELIQKTDQIIEHTQRLKKGLMHKLLTKGINNNVFKDSHFGRIPVNWAIDKLERHIKIVSGEYFPYQEFSDHGIPVLKIDNVMYGKVDWTTKTYLPEAYLDIVKYIILNEGDIVLALNRPITNSEVKVAQLTKNDVSILYQRVGKIKFTSHGIIDKDFFYLYLRSQFFRKLVSKILIGSDQPYVKTTELLRQKFTFPSDLEEQKQISRIVKSIDYFIKNEVEHNLSLQKLKIGLMQNLLTGKIRVML